MALEDPIYEAVERLEWDERTLEDTPHKRLRQFTRRTALTGGAAGVAAMMLEACGGSSSKSSSASAASGGSGGAASGIFGFSKKLKFTMVNHVTTNTFFTPTQNGAADACKLLGCTYQWTGSQSSNISEMVNAFNSAKAAGVDGLAISLIDLHAFNTPVASAISAGIPVVAYNADVATNARLAYIGQDLLLSGQKVGEHIAALVPSGDVALFIATPGALNLQPRIDGIMDTLKKHPSIKPHTVATGSAVPAELSAIQAYVTGHPNVKGLFAVDGGSTQGVAETMHKQNLTSKGVKGGGYDLQPATETLLQAGVISFAVDQQPYLQGFLPIVELYLYNASQKLAGIADVDTGLRFLDKTTIKPYAATKSRYEGTGSSAGVQKA